MTFPMDNPRKRIDFIFTRALDPARTAVSVRDVCVMDLQPAEGVHSSDHFPLLATLRLRDVLATAA